MLETDTRLPESEAIFWGEAQGTSAPRVRRATLSRGGTGLSMLARSQQELEITSTIL